MQRLALLCAGLTLTLIGMITLSRGIGRGEAVGQNIRWWSFSECKLPCWGGIFIGTTSELEAEYRLRLVFPTPETALQLDAWMVEGKPSVDVQRVLDNKTVDQGNIRFGFANQVVSEIVLSGKAMPALGELIGLLGPPSCVATAITGKKSNDYFILLYTGLKPGQTVQIGYSIGASNDWSRRVTYVDIHTR